MRNFGGVLILAVVVPKRYKLVEKCAFQKSHRPPFIRALRPYIKKISR